MPEIGSFPTYTKQYHHEPYAAISPTRPELSTQGKNVVITGGGGEIGAAMALSFAQSGASSIALLGRTEAALLKSKKAVNAAYPATDVHIIRADVADEASVRAALEKFASVAGRKLDILVANASVLPDPGTVLASDASQWWSGFEINVRGQFNLVRAFVPLAEKNATLINVTSSVAQFPFVPGSSSYHGSKLAAVKIFDYLHFENPELRVLQFHPGVVQSSMSQKSFDSGIPRPTMDDAFLPGNFAVWCASPESESLRGRFLWANWDVEELKEKASEFEGGSQLTMGLVGWP
ncbi:NAD(P)-binding protein [Trichoderma citrinoviride]|uniref:NAD(P)-binding protein n=1 Tax=Trichoderma citrinoviride TaxID=58853 RepID=A0A2T4BLW7_9HYPO|nr:NAD(P)-binding protein [Trichoderma citrinoviride]PTB70306.1 NAD(P)-binding protein [Trichoderma citrinoviride]